MIVDAAKFGWKPGDVLEISGKSDAVTADAFGKPNQPRDYHGRWGEGGHGANDSLHGDAAYDHALESTPVLPAADQKPFSVYRGYGYTMINGELRATRGNTSRIDDERLNGWIKTIDHAFTSNPNVKPLKKGIVVTRGMNDVHTAFGSTDPAAIKGKVITDHGFVSTTTNDEHTRDFMRVRGTKIPGHVTLNVPAKTKVIAADKVVGATEAPYYDRSESEFEVILNRGTSMRVTNATMRDGIMEIEADVI